MRVPTIDAALPARRVGPRRSSKCVAKKAANKCRDASARDPIEGPRNNELLRNLWRAEAGLLERNPADSDGRDAPPPWRGRALRDTRPDRRSACPCLGAGRGVGRVFPLLGDWGVPPARTHVQMRESRQGGKRGSDSSIPTIHPVGEAHGAGGPLGLYILGGSADRAVVAPQCGGSP